MLVDFTKEELNRVAQAVSYALRHSPKGSREAALNESAYDKLIDADIRSSRKQHDTACTCFECDSVRDKIDTQDFKSA